MGTDRDWVALRAVVEEGLRDAWGQEAASPPSGRSEQDLQDTADTVTDHLASAFAGGALVERRRWWRRWSGA